VVTKTHHEGVAAAVDSQRGMMAIARTHGRKDCWAGHEAVRGCWEAQ
jgi:hypothetical protein